MSTPIEPTPASVPEPVEAAAVSEPATGVEPDETRPTEPQEGTTVDPWADPEAARKEIEKLRRESASHRTKARDRDELALKVKQFEQSQLSAQERLEAQLADSEKRSQALQARTVRAEVRAAAGGFADPDDAAAFLALDSYVDAQGDVDAERIAADLADLLARKPHLAKAAPISAAAPPAEPRRPLPDRTQASGANHPRTSTPADEFAGWLGAAQQTRR